MPDYAPLLNEALWQIESLESEISRQYLGYDDEEAQPGSGLDWLHQMKNSLNIHRKNGSSEQASS